MDVERYERLKAGLIKVLCNHFEQIDKPEEIARGLLSDLSTGQALESLEGSDKPPQKDVENIDRAAKALSKAREALSQVGFHGSRNIGQSFEDAPPEMWQSGFGFARISLNTREILTEHLRQVEVALATASDGVDLDGQSANTAFGQGPAYEKFSGVGKQRKTAAYLFACELAQVYFAQTRKEPSVSTKYSAYGNPAYGAFLDLVKDVFAAIEIDASPERWARIARKDFSPKKNSQKLLMTLIKSQF